MDVNSEFVIIINNTSETYIMKFLSINQCAQYWLTTGELDSSYFLAGSDLIFDDFRIECKSDYCAQQLSNFLSAN